MQDKLCVDEKRLCADENKLCAEDTLHVKTNCVQI